MQHPMFQHIDPSISPMMPWFQKSLMLALMPVVLMLYTGLPQATTPMDWHPSVVDVDATSSGSLRCSEAQPYSLTTDPSHQDEYSCACDRIDTPINTTYTPINPSAPQTGSINGMR